MKFHIWIASVLIFLSLFKSSDLNAYDEFSHEWITRNALGYLKGHPHVYPETSQWIEQLGNSQGMGEESLVHAVVDTDFRTDSWLTAIFHSPFVGGRSDGMVTLFTSLYHFLNVTKPGNFWENDGYAYRHSTKKGNDSYLGYFTVTVYGRDSTALGGRVPAGEAMHGADLGVYNVGFKGTKHEWKKMFKEGVAADAVFPPSNVVAQMAYNVMLQSDRAKVINSDAWMMNLPLVTGLFSMTHLKRKYWRAEVAGLPKNFDMLGMSMHLIQDATVPQHTEGTSDNCHPEFESMVDDLTCGSGSAQARGGFYDGSYYGPRSGCGMFYDPTLVTVILSQRPVFLDGTKSVGDLMVDLARVSAQWEWKTDRKGNRHTRLPSGQVFNGAQCSDILNHEEVVSQAKFQYNLAVAQTVTLFERAAHEYEGAHPTPNPSGLRQILNLLDYLIPSAR